MMVHKGTSVSEGIATGTIFFVELNSASDKVQKCDDPEKEIERLNEALDIASGELMELYEKACQSADDSVADIFMIHSMMLQDDDFRNRMMELIREDNFSAISAVSLASKEFSESLADSGSDYIAERGADISDVESRVIRILQGTNALSLPGSDEKIVLVANEITPSLTLMFERNQLLGLVSAKGSATCHAAILAKSLGIPCVITPGVNFGSEINGKTCIVNALDSFIVMDPDSSQLEEASSIEAKFLEDKKALELLKDAPCETKDGRKVKLFCNVGSLEDIDQALKNNAEGIGLFRSEFMYLGRVILPTEEELADVYTKAAKKLGDKKLVIRTLDIGADKKTECIPMKDEENPALGIRALRLCFAQPELFQIQLRAILRAAIHGNISVMFPMISSVSEIRRAKFFMAQAADDLTKRNIPHADKIETGIMVETPAAAIISDLLAKEVDFFSLGTNDLTQYTLAVDRQNEDAAPYCDAHHEAVLRLIELTCKNAHDNNIWCGICGELGSDISVTERFVNAGIDELSVGANSILKVKKRIREL